MDSKKPKDPEGAGDRDDEELELPAGSDSLLEASAGDPVGVVAPAQLGVSRYVHAAFLAAALLVGYLTSQTVLLIWNRLADWPAAIQYLPQLVQYDEEIRSDIGLGIGALVGILVVLRLYSRPAIRAWSLEVASELAKVTWPDRDMVTRGTIIVIVASLIATLYITVLDRFWGFTTGLVYAP